MPSTEVFAAFAQGLGSGLPLRLHQGVDALPQRPVADVDEAPGLHVAHRGRQVGGLHQAFQQSVGQGLGAEVAHVAPFFDGAAHRGDLGFGVAVFVHGRNSRAAAAGLDGK